MTPLYTHHTIHDIEKTNPSIDDTTISTRRSLDEKVIRRSFKKDIFVRSSVTRIVRIDRSNRIERECATTSALRDDRDRRTDRRTVRTRETIDARTRRVVTERR